MDCAEEVSLLRARLSRVAGVRDLRFDVLHARMDVEYAPAKVTPASIEQVVRAVGMRCEPWQAGPARLATRRERWRQALTWVSGLGLAAGMSWQLWQGTASVAALLAHQHGDRRMPALSLALFAVAVVAGAGHTLPRAWRTLRALRPDMNLLVVLSLAGASALGEWTEAATLAFLFALAGRLESWSMARARRAITRLLAVAPAEAWVVHGEHEHRAAVGAVSPGTLIRVRPGERIPFDGEVVGGTSLVNQALITGESVAVEKSAGGAVFAGAINESGTLEIRTTRPASDTTLARMVRMVEESRSRRSPSERLIERFSRRYTPAVLLLAFTVAIVPPLFRGGAWGEWFYQGMVILLISCPCALVISTPVSITAALASAAGQGVLVKGGAFLEEAARRPVLALHGEGVFPGYEEALRARGVEPVRLRDAEPGAMAALLRQYGSAGMLGDCVADAESLALASLGISLGRHGADMARESADVILMTDDPRRVLFLIDHARRALAVVRQNIVFALAAKALFLAAAFAGAATLWMAVAADMGATLAVTLNGLRLLHARPHLSE
ncbi:MAG: heavy metal translocating P-type ATPase [Candidatus Solibacter usitatus]|nr:heavy metal translocating P-type ATPase [Candidatus Solibacter usitatus]